MTLQTLKSLVNLDEGGPLRPIRQKAWEKFQEFGLPTKKSGAFQYIPLQQFYQSLSHVERSASLETLEKPNKFVMLPLSEAMKTYGAIISSRFVQLQKEEQSPFSLLNQASSDEGLFIYVPPGVELKEPIILSRHSRIFPKVMIFLGKNAKASVLMTEGSNSFSSALLDCSLDEGASLSRFHATWQTETSFYFDSVRASLKRDSKFHSFSLTSGSRCAREDIQVSLEGENAETDLNGLWLLKDKREAHTLIKVEHKAPYTRSNQYFKGVNADFSKSSFEGKIYVHPEAQKTEGYQLSNNLLLGERARAYAKPNLEIFADDVKASHGATVSKLSEEELFYLKTRGLSSGDAASHLIYGFCQDMFRQIPIPALKLQAEKSI